jgi:hypothetical protein
MLRVCAIGSRTLPAKYRATQAARGVLTWSLIAHEWRDKAPHKTRWFKENFAFVDAPSHWSEQGQVMQSEIKADLDQLLHTDWTYNRNAYWPDVLASHDMAFGAIYEGKSAGLVGSIGKMTGMLPNLSSKTDEKEEIAKQLSDLRTAVEWAEKTEAVYTTIFDQKFKLEREVWEPFEREKILAGLIQMYLEFIQTVPQEFKVKVKRELEYHLFALRRMVFDCPNVKRAFPTFMA